MNATIWMAATLAAGVAITAFAAWRQGTENERATVAAVRVAADRVAADVTERIYLYQYGVRGARGAVLIAGENGITHELFARYAASRDLKKEFPGARGFGFVRRVPAAEEQRFLDATRRGGRPDFRILQLAPHDRERRVIEFIEPLASNAFAVGLDIESDPNRSEAAAVSMRTGETMLSAPITLMQNPDPSQKAFLLMMPVYRPGTTPHTPDEREANTFGWTYAALSMNDVLAHVRMDPSALHVVLRDITRPGGEEVIFETQPLDGDSRIHPQRLERTVFGREWVVEVSAHPAFVNALNLTRPRSILLIGTIASLLLAALAGAASVNLRRKHSVAARMADFNARLERQVVERTEELTQAKASAESANAAKGRFLAIMSHELRTPMAGVLGIGELLLSSDLKPDQQGLMRTLMGSARALLDLLNDILDFAKIEAGRVELDETDFSVRQVIEDVRTVLAPLASEKGNVIDTNVHESLGPAQLGDAKRYRQILMNLVGNANKFTTKGKITISVKALPLADGAVMVETTVTDTGVGIAPDNRGRLFQPFVQEDTSTSRRYGGTGLGLAISKTLAELMGGRIWLDSELGMGSAFGFTVVLREGNIEKAGKTGEIVRNESSGVSPATRPLRVLVAEDNETNRILALRLLSKMGHKVTALENGALAVEEAGRRSFDVILMDMQMPVMDGPAAIRIIRGRERPPERMPIIALTADAMRENHRDYLDAGADIIMIKPVDWASLAAEMERLTRGKQVRPSAKEPDGPALPAILDAELLEAILESLGADLRALLDGMITEASRLAEILTEAAKRNEVDKVCRAAHSLKGLASQFGALRLAAIAARIEQAAKRGEKVEPLLPEVEFLAGEAFAALRVWLREVERQTGPGVAAH